MIELFEYFVKFIQHFYCQNNTIYEQVINIK